MLSAWLESRFLKMLEDAPADVREDYHGEMVEVFRARLKACPNAWVRLRVGIRELRSLRQALTDMNAQDGGAWKQPPRGTSGRTGSATWIEDRIRDLRYAGRALRHNPTYTVVAVCTLALGIGATTAMFTVVNGVLLRPLPYPSPDDLVAVYAAIPDRGVERGAFSMPNFEDIEEQTRGQIGMGAYWVGTGVILGDQDPMEIPLSRVSPGFFATLSVTPHLGRTFDEQDDETNNRVLVLSYGLWSEAYGADSTLIGSTLNVDQESYTVTGVMPKGFNTPGPSADAWTLISTIAQDAIPTRLRQVNFLGALARLEPGRSAAELEVEMGSVMRGLVETYPDINNGRTEARIIPLQEIVVGNVDRALWVLMGAVGFILLIACLNVANLQLVRGESRLGELAIRSSLGASKRRVLAQLLTEGLLVAVGGALLGSALAKGAIVLLHQFGADLLPRGETIALDGTALTFAFGVSLFTVLVFALLPSVSVARQAPAATLRSGGRGSIRGQSLLSRSLITLEVGLALSLVVGAGLLGRSLMELQDVDLGFNPDNALAVTYTISTAEHPDTDEWMGIYWSFSERVRNLPGVRAAGSIRALPLTGIGEQVPYHVPGTPMPEPGAFPSIAMQPVGPGVFEALGIPLLQGRGMEATDGRDSEFVVIVLEGFAREHYGDNPINQEIQIGSNSARIIGVAGDVRQTAVRDEPTDVLYFSQGQISRVGMTMVVRTEGDPMLLAGPVRNIMADLNPNQPITRIESLTSVVAGSLGRPRFFALLLAAFSTTALVLASVGVYGVVAYSVAQRTREIQLRLALGASGPSEVRRSVRIGMIPSVAGVALGLALAFFLSKAMASLVFGIPETDTTTFVLSALALAGAALLAAWLPARRASKEDPARILG